MNEPYKFVEIDVQLYASSWCVRWVLDDGQFGNFVMRAYGSRFLYDSEAMSARFVSELLQVAAPHIAAQLISWEDKQHEIT